MSLKALGKALDTTGLGPTEKLALIYLADRYTDDGGTGRLPLASPAEKFAAFAGCSQHEAAETIKALFSKRVLRRVPPPQDLLFPDEDQSGVWFHMDVTQAWEIEERVPA